jgi:hypothetical protein
VGLVVDLPACGEQVLEPALADEVVAFEARPLQERRVDAHDRPVGKRREVAARRVLVEVLCALDRDVAHGTSTGRP